MLYGDFCVKMFALLLLKQKMEVNSMQQIEAELRRALNLNQDQPPLNSRRPKGSTYESASTSLPSGDVNLACTGSPQVTSSPQNTVSNPSHAGAADKLPTASSSSPSINSVQASGPSGVGPAPSKRRKWRQSKHNGPRHVPHDAVDGSGKNVSDSQQSVVLVKPSSPGVNSAMTTPVHVDDSASGLSTCGNVARTPTALNPNSNVSAGVKTVTDQKGGKAPKGRGRGVWVTTHTGVSAVAGQAPLQKPKSDDNTHDAAKHHVTVPGQLLCTDSNVNVKSAPLPRTADKNVTDLSNKASAKVAQNGVKLPVKEHQKGRGLLLLQMDIEL